jgi:hypothetical protein
MRSFDKARELSRTGVQARALSRHAARRISENFRYVEILEAFRPRPKVARLPTFDGPLPASLGRRARGP